LQFFEETVVFRIGDGGRVQHVVLVGVVMELFAQRRCAGGNVWGGFSSIAK
jgi:hypothetical protein